MKFRVLIDRDEKGVFVAGVPALPGCITQGTTRQEALSNIRMAVADYLESLQSYSLATRMTEEVVEVSV
ncbi:MAG: type II toxin-antitoxin system HicB family antitoxin [candidate division Zixibacteria bacterium]|nr:type II toxin-antitoxin system HicB family antitoxin [candidate division Zixibacteria bacterium]